MKVRSGTERRKFKRYKVNFEAIFTDGEMLFSEHVQDISCAGVRLSSTWPWKEGTPAKIMIETTPSVKVSGTVCWFKKGDLRDEMGIRFSRPLNYLLCSDIIGQMIQ